MKKGKSRVNFSEETGITNDALAAYLEGTLPAEQVSLFERLLEQDEFAREAVEGWRAVNHEMALAKLNEIEATVRARTGLEETKIVNINYGRWLFAAATVIMFVGLGFLMVQWWGAQQKQVALQENTPSAETVLGGSLPVVADSMITAVDSLIDSTILNASAMRPDTLQLTEDQVSTKAVLQDPIANNLENKSSKDKTEAVEKQNMNAGAAVATTLAPAAAPQHEPAVAEVVMAEKGATKKSAADASGYTNDDTKSLRTLEVKEAEVTVEGLTTESLMTKARDDFNKGEYKKASTSFNKILSKEPENIDALYFGGISDYVSGNYKRAEKNFDKLLKQGKKYNDGSKWYKANILLKAGKKEAATDLYRELTNTNGSFKDRAIKKMEELGYN